MAKDTTHFAGISIETKLGIPVGLTVTFDTIREYENGDKVLINRRQSKRDFEAIASQPLHRGPVTLQNYGDLHALLANCCQCFPAEDMALEAKRATDLKAANDALLKAGPGADHYAEQPLQPPGSAPATPAAEARAN